MVQLALAYSTVYQLGLDQVCTHSQGKIFFHTAQSVSACLLPDHCTLIFPDVTVPLSCLQGIITGAVNYSRSLDLKRGLVNIEKFVSYLNRELQN